MKKLKKNKLKSWNSIPVPPNAKRPETEYEILCGDECVEIVCGPTEDAWRNAMFYASEYAEDGKIQILEIIRKKVKL